ncbi:hypothetical protein OC861_007027, partial [Tilletia horrida]
MSTLAAVFTATGNQGSSVLNALTQTFGKSLTIRAFTRNPSAARTQAALAKYEGKADIVPVQADVADAESVREALKGVKVVFGNANSYDDLEQEVPRMKAVIDIAKEAGVELFVWSTLPSPAKDSNGKYTKVKHFENKAEIQAYLEQSGLNWASVSLGIFAENVTNYGLIKPSDDGKSLNLGFPVLKPETTIGWTWVERDLGPAVAVLFKAHLEKTNPELFKRIHYVASYQGSWKQLGDLITARTGKPVNVIVYPQGQSEEMTQMLEYYNDYSLYADQTLPPPELKSLGAPFSTLE